LASSMRSPGGAQVGLFRAGRPARQRRSKEDYMTPARLILRPLGHGRFEAYLNGALICASCQPLLDGARGLLERGHSRATLLTTRHEGKPYDNFIPKQIGDLAKWDVEEGPHGPRFRRHRPPTGGKAPPMRIEGSELPPEASDATRIPDAVTPMPAAAE